MSDRPWDNLAELANAADASSVGEFVENLPIRDVPLVVSRLSQSERLRVVNLLGPDGTAEMLDHMPDAQAVDLLDSLEPDAAAAILHELPSDQRSDLIGEMESADAEAILAVLEPDEARDVRALIAYEDDVAGGLMVTELLRYREEQTVRDVLDDMSQNAERYQDYDVQYAYVCDQAGRLTGVLRLRDLVLARRTETCGSLMIRDPKSVVDTASLDDLLDFFDAHRYFGAPVVDADGRLVGVVRSAAVDDARAERDDRTILKLQGIMSGEELRTMPVALRARRRLAWLTINILLNVMAASVIAAYQETISAVIALAVFLPIISDMSGCSGNQAVAVSLRELAVGLIRPVDVMRVWVLEVLVGLINGIALGVLIGVVATVWMGNGYLGLVIGLALCLNTLVAVSLGGVIPLVLKRFGVDPAVAAGPILTTVTDMCGFLFTLGIATLMLSRLVPAT